MREKYIRMMKNLISVLIILLVLIPQYVYASETDTRYYETSCESETYFDNPDIFDTLTGLPIGTTSTNVKGLPVNYRLWFAKRIVVYGKPADCNSSNSIRKNFKFDTKNPSRIPFYRGYNSKTGSYERGEYRYHGYTKDGNLYTNIDFPDDIDLGMELGDKNWVYRYWDSTILKIKYQNREDFVLSDFNDTAINFNNELGQKTKDWINNGITAFNINNGVNDKGEYKSSRDFSDYINILSAPTSRYSGEGRMFHRLNDGRFFYQTFTVKNFSKEHTPVNVSVEIVNKGDLEIEDYGDENREGYENETVDIIVKIKAELDDGDYFTGENADVKKALYYNREDIEYWTISLDGQQAQAEDVHFWDNKAEAVFTVPMTIGQITAIKDIGRTFTGVARCYYSYINDQGQREYDQGSNNSTADFTVNEVEVKKVAVIIRPECVIPTVGFDIVPFAAHDNTDMTDVTDKSVYINGQEIDYDSFFSGSYVFGTGNDGLKRIDVYYTSVDGEESFSTHWAYIYDTKPKAGFKLEGTYKQNRKLTLTDTSTQDNIQLVVQNYPITEYQWGFRGINGDDGSRRMRDISEVYKEIMYKEPGSYEIELVVTNSLGRVSDPYIVKFEVLQDYEPAIEIDLDYAVMARGEQISAWNYNAVSTDNDNISSNIIELWYDSDNDGECDQLINTYNGNDGFPEYQPDKLGKYKFVNMVEESFGEETLQEFIADEDKVIRKVEREFMVDNLVPMTGLYVDIPIVRPQVDVYIMMDKNLESSKVEYLKTNRINLDNFLRSKNILPEVNLWDMHTYTYSQPAGTSRNTGTSYPPSSVSYSSNGYSGTLRRTSVSDNGHYHDYGEWKTVTLSKTEYGTLNTTSWREFRWNGSSWVSIGTSTNVTNQIWYSSGGYTGWLYKYDYSFNGESGSPPSNPSVGDTYRITRYWTGYYSGTVTKPEQVWEPDVRWVPDYTGYYSGTIYKQVRQPYTNPFRETSCKYVIYVSDTNINELNDLQNVMSKSDSELILIGADSIQGQISHDHYIATSTDIGDAMQQAFGLVAAQSPAVEEYYVLAGTGTFTMHTADFDEEGDWISEEKFQYVHEPDYFDNPMGMEDFAAPEFSESANWIDLKAESFSKPGLFRIYRRIKDRPVEAVDFENFSYYSGIQELRIISHRKPVASAVLDWDYDPSKGAYKTRWVDLSYDLDHQFSRDDKGIIERKIMFRRVGGDWYYRIPEELEAGAYELRYFVKDVENAWSEPFIMNFTLNNVPPPQMDAKLRTLDDRFSLWSIPASEYVQAYDIWTRYPYDIKLEMALYDGSLRVSPLKIVSYAPEAGTKTGNDIFWNDISYCVPETLRDGSYTFKISSVDTGSSSLRAEKAFPLKVNTPIGIIPDMPGQMVTDAEYDIRASTSKYADTMIVTLFKDTPWQITLDMSGSLTGEGRDWTAGYKVPVTIPENTYTAEYRASTPNGNVEVKQVEFEVKTLKIMSVSIVGYWNHWRGQVDMFGKQMADQPHRFLSLEKVKITVNTAGCADRVVIRFSPELEDMQFTDGDGHVYDYGDDFFGYHVQFPQDSTINIDNPKPFNSVYWEYSLPLAPSTLSWDGDRLCPPYTMTVYAYKGGDYVTYEIDDIDITGNIYDLTYIQPVN